MSESHYGPVDFSTYVISVASSAMVALGRMPSPDGKPHPIELDTAKHLIDILEMLEQKTKGNLDATEAKLVTSLLHDLHGSFAAAQANAGASKP
jgi:hypothetical protein